MDFEALRAKMVQTQLTARGIKDEKVIEAFSSVPREEFVPNEFIGSAYGDFPLSIGCNQTISQPYIVALMTQALELRGKERILEIGTGSGYQTAILSGLCSEVYSVERLAPLADKARLLLERLGCLNVKIKVADGTEGWSEFSAFDGIIVTAASPEIPKTLVGQLSADGKMVIPIGGHFSQMLTLVQKTEDGFFTKDICGCVFVPLVGKHGWHGRGLKEYN